jgi:hypothetical protein
MRERMFYFSKMASQHSFDRLQAQEDWERAGLLERAHQQAKNIQLINLQKEKKNQN